MEEVPDVNLFMNNLSFKLLKNMNKEAEADELDYVIKKKVWYSKVPLTLHFHGNGANDTMAYRCSYLPVLIERIFQENHIYWVDYHEIQSRLFITLPKIDTLVKWYACLKYETFRNYPVGLLADIYWDYAKPLEFVLNLDIKETNFKFNDLSEYALSILKQVIFVTKFFWQSNYLKYGNVQKIMNLSITDQNSIWSSIESHNFEEYCEINRKINGTNYVKNIPFRLYLPDGKVIQEPFSPLTNAKVNQLIELKRLKKTSHAFWINVLIIKTIL
ncbi:Autophagy-related protein 5 domain-containing protein [Rozella allomycis CSF55]|uniref:Autophagy-related protein 5 domain-containing protein n=1 Tax=Rozella allomycis (strain CSF55) TaxID=988480 RepID=A0A075B1J5_ROZAC|nr:Autophagy-related protein 5 domain-containing protein [Rozella allomycis CSF55]|eukprot:EPZ36228.1 Autophagy-related protein 5 domain-containing protein [Rozella allomycis CSF55]